MAWTATYSFVALDVLTATQLNTMQANIDYLKLAVSAQIFISVSELFPRTGAAGCAALATTTMATNLQDVRTFDFDASSSEYAMSVIFKMPSDYNGGAFTYNIMWKHAATTVNFKVAWAVYAIAYADDLALDSVWGSAVQVNDVGGTTSDFYITPESAAVTPGGSAAAGCGMMLLVQRVATDATNDTLAIDAGLIGVQITYTRN